MFKFLKYIKNQFLLSKKLDEEEERQKREGYKIEFLHEGNESDGTVKEINLNNVQKGSHNPKTSIVYRY